MLDKGSITIIEGMRCAGKTRLLREVITMDSEIVPLKFRRIHDPFMEMQLIIQAMETLDKRFLIDRFHLTELVYRWRDGLVPVDKLFLGSYLIEHLLQSLNATTFVLTIDHGTYLKRMAERSSAGLASAEEDMPYEKAKSLWNEVPSLIKAKTIVLQNNAAADLAFAVKAVFNATRRKND